MKLSNSLNENISLLKKALISDDITFLNVTISGLDCVLIFVNDLVNKDMLGELILRPASIAPKNINEEQLRELHIRLRNPQRV